MEIDSGKTLRLVNLSNEYNRMIFLIFRFSQMCGKQLIFRTAVRKTSEKKNKMDNSQNGYSSVWKTEKIKKSILYFS